MKKFTYLMALLFAMPLISQENQNTITVIGETEKTVTEKTYTVLVSLQQIIPNEYEKDKQTISLYEVKQNYINQLRDIRIDFSRFRRNTYYELALSYSQTRETACYSLTTNKKEEVRKIIKLSLAGVSIVDTEINAEKLTNEQLAKLSKKAIVDAKQKAKAIAKKINKTVGDIVNITDQNTNVQYIQNYGTSTSQQHNVTVVFELK